MKILSLILRLLLGAVFIFSAITKLFPIEVFELNFVYQGIANWDIAPFLSRGLIIIELFLGIALLFKKNLKEYILPATLVLLIAFSIYLIYSMVKDGNSGNCGCFGTIFPMTPLESLIKNIVLIAISIYLYRNATTSGPKMNWLHPSIFVVVSASIVMLFPVYEYTFKDNNKQDEKADIINISGFNTKEPVNLGSGKKLVAVFNMACDHCVEVALKLSAVRSRIQLPPSYYVLIGDSSEVRDFYSLTNSDAPYVVKPLPEFVQQYKSGWPRVFLLKEGIIHYDNNRRTFNGADFEKVAEEFNKE